MHIPIAQIQVNKEYESLVPRVTAEEYQTMKQSIHQHGIREPIVLNPDKILIDGHTRVQIAKELGLKEIPYREEFYKDTFEEQEAVIAYNLERRQLNLMQLGILGNKLEGIEKEKAKIRQLATLKQNTDNNVLNSIFNIIPESITSPVVLNSTPRTGSEESPPEPTFNRNEFGRIIVNVPSNEPYIEIKTPIEMSRIIIK